MNHQILVENQKKRIDKSLLQLICFAMFNFWQMGFIYYFLEPSSAMDGKIPLPINVDNATLLMVVCYLLSILTMIFFAEDCGMDSEDCHRCCAPFGDHVLSSSS